MSEPDDKQSTKPEPVVTFGEVWKQLNEIENLSDIRQVVLLFLAAIGASLSRVPGLTRLGRLLENLLYYSFAYVSPELKFDFKKTFEDYRTRPILFIGLLCGLIVSLGYPVFFSWWAGTLFPGPSIAGFRRISLCQDSKNLQIYTLISPAYLALSSAIIITAFRGWVVIPPKVALESHHGLFRSLFRFATASQVANTIIMLLFVTFIAIWVNVNQFQSIMNVTPAIGELYWFVDLSPKGDPVLNKAGVAYSIINAVKFMVILGAAVCYFASAVEMFRISGQVALIRAADAATLEEWRGRLRHYALIELLAKCLILVLAVHASIFAKQPWAPDVNALFQGLAVLFVGILVVPFPRFYFEYCWLIDERKASAGQKWPDLRPMDLRKYFVIISAILYACVTIFGANTFTIVRETLTKIFGSR